MRATGVREWLARLELAHAGYFDAIGWFRPRAERRARDADGNAIPWFTYPAIAFLADRVPRGVHVLEFGSGMGTVWWARRADTCIAFEHDAAWAAQVRAQCPADIRLVDGGSPSGYLAPLDGLGRFQVVVVDGLHRNECLSASIAHVADDGVVVLDDAQRPEYAPGIDVLRTAGYRTLPFHGPQPVSKHAGCTMIFYRPGNLLGL